MATKCIHYIVTRLGPDFLRKLAFDEKYRSGIWNFPGESAGELGLVVRRYLRKGDLLVMGCGGASILEGLEADGLNSALGVDLSEEALRLASRYTSKKVSFQQINMMDFVSSRSFDVILFSESLNYVPAVLQKPFLGRMVEYLKPGGVLIVTLAQAKRYKAILERIRLNFAVLEDRTFIGSSRHMIIFRVAQT